MIIASQKISNKTLLIAGGILLVFVLLGALLPKGVSIVSNNKAPEVKLTLAAIGEIPELSIAMKRNDDLRDRVDLLMTYETMTLFTNYREVNALVSEIIFLWSGLTLDQLGTMNANQAIEYFLRKAYGISPDRPVKNNPFLGERPWPRQFNRMKARLLMMGQGKGIYKGLAYFDSERERMIVDGIVSAKFVKNFAKFLKTQEAPKRYRNNFLIFIDNTKGFNNLSAEERALIMAL